MKSHQRGDDAWQYAKAPILTISILWKAARRSAAITMTGRKSYDADNSGRQTITRPPHVAPRRSCAISDDLRARGPLPLLELRLRHGHVRKNVAPHEAGFTCIDGTDIVPGMLEVAREKGGLSKSVGLRSGHPLDDRAGKHAAIIAGRRHWRAGAAPVDCHSTARSPGSTTVTVSSSPGTTTPRRDPCIRAPTHPCGAARRHRDSGSRSRPAFAGHRARCKGLCGAQALR